MTMVDTSVWIDYFRGTKTAESEWLDSRLGVEPLAIGDLIMTEILQGVHPKKSFQAVLKQLESFECVQIGGKDVAIQAARNYQYLRERGATVRKTIDTLIATRCIMSDISLLHSDRDFDPFVVHLGLKSPLSL